jgi:hypothetical protein
LLINTYAVPSLTLTRSLDVGYGFLPNFMALAVGPTGDIFLLEECAGSFGQGLTYSVAVYAPGASGNQQPLQNIQICSGDTEAALGLDVDGQGRLYVAINTPDEVEVIDHPATKPKIVRTFALGFGPNQMTIDRSSGEVYVDVLWSSPVYVYPEGAHGSPQPQRVIQATDGAGGQGMTTYGPYLFAVGGPGVNQLYKRHKDTQDPIATVTDEWASSLAAGP